MSQLAHAGPVLKAQWEKVGVLVDGHCPPVTIMVGDLGAANKTPKPPAFL
jgi:hypothetical protein